MDWDPYYPQFRDALRGRCSSLDDSVPLQLAKHVTVADIGCGFGGLLVALALKLPEELLLGLD